MRSQVRLAGCILTNNHDEILLLHRNTARRIQWEIPGGKVEPGESAEHAAVRELREELKVDVRIVKHLGSKVFEEDGTTLHYSWYLGEVEQGSPAIGEPQTFDDLRYFARAGLKAIRGELSANAQNFLDAWLAFESILVA